MPTTRRRMLRGAGAALAGGATTALVLHRTTDRAAAADADLTVAGDEATIRDETLAAVWLDATVAWAYDLPSGERPATVTVELLAGTSADDLAVVGTADTDVTFLEADGEETFSVDLLDAGVLDADALVPAEGETTSTEIHVGAEMACIDESGLTVAADSQTTAATVTIERSAYDPDEYGAVGGVGNVTVELQ